MAARLITLGDDDVHPVVDVPLRVLGLAGQRRHPDALLVGPVDDVLGRRTKGVDDQLDRMGKGHFDVGTGHVLGPADHPAVGLLVSR